MLILKGHGIFLLLVFLTGTLGLHIRFIATIIGSRSHMNGSERMGSAYDVAVQKSIKKYPEVFQNFSMTRYFVPGNFTCAEAEAEITVGLGEFICR
jgi:hypothetical protein